MSKWGRRTFGEPCRECGFSWDLETVDALALVGGVHGRLSDALRQADGTERHPSLTWPVVAYVAHIADNLRIWAERVVSAQSESIEIASYDENALASARRYDALHLTGALWTLDWASKAWTEAMTTTPSPVIIFHPVRGEISLADVVATNAHDIVHHEWDIHRTLSSAPTT